jgi:hypothetical protein
MPYRFRAVCVALLAVSMLTRAEAAAVTIAPDADTTTVGWTTAPLFSSVNDAIVAASDATFIRSTAGTGVYDYECTMANAGMSGLASQLSFEFRARISATEALTYTVQILYSTDGTLPSISAGTATLTDTFARSVLTVSGLALTKAQVDNLKVIVRAAVPATGTMSIDVSCFDCVATYDPGATPDADTATVGWTVVPVWPKLNDTVGAAADATFAQ